MRNPYVAPALACNAPMAHLDQPGDARPVLRTGAVALVWGVRGGAGWSRRSCAPSCCRRPPAFRPDPGRP